MITPQHLIDAITMQFGILKHLGSKVTAENKETRLTPAQRSIEELQHYIVSSFPAQIKLMVLGTMDNEVYMNYVNQYVWFTFDQFAQALDAWLAVVTKEILSLSDAQWHETITLWWGMTGPRTMFLNDYVLEFLGAYKMQLFLQLKVSGLSDIGTMNLRAWMDAPKS